MEYYYIWLILSVGEVVIYRLCCQRWTCSFRYCKPCIWGPIYSYLLICYLFYFFNVTDNFLLALSLKYILVLLDEMCIVHLRHVSFVRKCFMLLNIFVVIWKISKIWGVKVFVSTAICQSSDMEPAARTILVCFLVPFKTFLADRTE